MSTCLIRVKGLDDRLSKFFTAYNTHQIAILWSLYKDKHSGHTVEEEFLEGDKTIKDLTDEDIKMMASDLVDTQDPLKEEVRHPKESECSWVLMKAKPELVRDGDPREC